MSNIFSVQPRSVGRLKRPMAEMCVKAVLAVADLDRRDVNLDLIKVGLRVCVCGGGVSVCVVRGGCVCACV